MRVEVNGDQREFADGSTLAQLLEALGVAHPGVAVAVDGEVVSRGRWDRTVPADGSKLDILTAVQGG